MLPDPRTHGDALPYALIITGVLMVILVLTGVLP